jgi:hypothetical protein
MPLARIARRYQKPARRSIPRSFLSPSRLRLKPSYPASLNSALRDLSAEALAKADPHPALKSSLPQKLHHVPSRKSHHRPLPIQAAPLSLSPRESRAGRELERGDFKEHISPLRLNPAFVTKPPAHPLRTPHLNHVFPKNFITFLLANPITDPCGFTPGAVHNKLASAT